MSTAQAPRDGAKNQKMVLVLAILLLVIAGGLFFTYTRNSGDPEAEARARAVSNPEAQLKAIQDNPNMPAMAKQIAIGQIQAHKNTGQQGMGQ